MTASATEHDFEQGQELKIVADEHCLAGPGALDPAEYDYDAAVHALDIGPESSAAEHAIDITTLGARSGTPRRIEVYFHRVGGRWYLTGVPGPRSWYANLRAHPRFIVHLKHGATADLPAPATPVDEETRRRVIIAVLDLPDRPEVGGAGQPTPGPRRLAGAQPAGRDRVTRRALADSVLGAVRTVRGSVISTSGRLLVRCKLGP